MHYANEMQEEMEVDKPATSINLPIYEYVRDAQLQHGLKYDDHRQYRSYCSRRIHRIRRSLNVVQGIASSAKARHTRARKLLTINNGMVLEAGEKSQEYAERMLVIPLCLSERAWSYAMQLKQEVSECPRRRFHLVRRLEKAAEHATRFEKLVHDIESPCSERTKKEATAYAAYMNGLYKMERENWTGAKDDFHKSLVLYTALSLSVTRGAFLEQYRLRIEELRASLRYCTFTLGEKPAVHKVKLPSTLQFHDIAFKHVRHLQEQEEKQSAATVPVVTSKAKTAGVTAPPTAKAGAVPAAAEKSDTKAVEPNPNVVEDDEDDEFEETREVIEEDQSEEEEESGSESDDDDQQQARGGGVTGLVKGWLGGTWS